MESTVLVVIAVVAFVAALPLGTIAGIALMKLVTKRTTFRDSTGRIVHSRSHQSRAA